MLMQDTLTGYVHEVPDGQLYESEIADYAEPIEEGQMVYDGLGNPVGFLKSLKRFAGKALRAAAPLMPLASRLAPFVPIPGVSLAAKAAERFVPALAQRLGPRGRALARMIPGLQTSREETATILPPGIPGIPIPGISGYYGEAAVPVPAAARPVPAGWIRRPSPYQGARGRRFYMRCAVWPGPQGLVPASAVQPQPAAVPAPIIPTPAVQPPPGPRRVVRRRR